MLNSEVGFVSIGNRRLQAKWYASVNPGNVWSRCWSSGCGLWDVSLSSKTEELPALKGPPFVSYWGTCLYIPLASREFLMFVSDCKAGPAHGFKRCSNNEAQCCAHKNVICKPRHSSNTEHQQHMFVQNWCCRFLRCFCVAHSRCILLLLVCCQRSFPSLATLGVCKWLSWANSLLADGFRAAFVS